MELSQRIDLYVLQQFMLQYLPVWLGMVMILSSFEQLRLTPLLENDFITQL